MKLFALIAALARAEGDEDDNQWNGVSPENLCGKHISFEDESLVNRTCTWTGNNVVHAFAGNGAFISGENSITGYDGASGAPDVIFFFSQEEDADGKMDNSTCWDVTMSCSDNANNEATQGVFFMETVDDFRKPKGASYNLQITGVTRGDTLVFALIDSDDNPWPVQNISAPFANSYGTEEDAWGNYYSNDGTFSIDVKDEPFGQLFQLSVTQQAGNVGTLNLWKSTVSN